VFSCIPTLADVFISAMSMFTDVFESITTLADVFIFAASILADVLECITTIVKVFMIRNWCFNAFQVRLGRRVLMHYNTCRRVYNS